MITFREKEFGKISKTIKYIEQHPTVPISLSALGVSSINMASNVKRGKIYKDYQEKQLKAMKDLTGALGKVDKTILKTEFRKPEEKKNLVYIFKRKSN